MVMKNRFIWVATLLAALVMLLPHSAPIFSFLFPQLERPVYTQEPFAWLLWQHILLVGASSLFFRGGGQCHRCVGHPPIRSRLQTAG